MIKALWLNASKRNSKRKEVGFTLLEFVVVVAIVGILTTMAAVTYNSVEDQRNVTLAVQQIQGDLRFAQNLATSFKKHQGKFARGGYGVHFENNSSVYKIFADLDCNGSSDCSPAGPLLAEGGSATSLQDINMSWSTNQWKGGDVFIRGGKCGGNLRFVAGNSADTLNIDAGKPFKNLDGTSCSPDITSEYTVFGNAQFDLAQGELVEEKRFDNVQILVPSSSYDIVFSPPTPEIKANRAVISSGGKVAITVSAGTFAKLIDVYSNGFIEIQ